MQGAGADFDADSALHVLARHMSLLQPQLPLEDTFEAATPFSDISSRFSLSGGHRCNPLCLLHDRQGPHTLLSYSSPNAHCMIGHS